MWNHFGPYSEASEWPEGKEWECPEAYLHHKGLHHLLREGDLFVDIRIQKIQLGQVSSQNIEEKKQKVRTEKPKTLQLHHPHTIAGVDKHNQESTFGPLFLNNFLIPFLDSGRPFPELFFSVAYFLIPRGTLSTPVR